MTLDRHGIHSAPRRDPPRGQTRRRTPTDTHTQTVRRAVTRGLALGERPFITEPTGTEATRPTAYDQ